MAEQIDASSAVPTPSGFRCYGHGSRMLRSYFLELLLITAIAFVLQLPTAGLWGDDAARLFSEYVSFNLILFKITGTPGAVLFSIAYLLLVEWPLDYGVAFASLTAARSQTPQVRTLFAAFSHYWNAVLANLLTFAIIGFGIAFLFVPGIIFACKLAFVPYLVVDRGMEPVQAVKESWRMTRGHAWSIFGMGLLAIPIAVAGLLMIGVGIILSVIWIRLAFATMYLSVSVHEKSPHPAPVT